jgi:hypothetical protein
MSYSAVCAKIAPARQNSPNAVRICKVISP